MLRAVKQTKNGAFFLSVKKVSLLEMCCIIKKFLWRSPVGHRFEASLQPHQWVVLTFPTPFSG